MNKGDITLEQGAFLVMVIYMNSQKDLLTFSVTQM